ncbi:MAG: Crp/Fnr family transcriptional regulator [Chitinophagales bacterium]
MSSDEIDDFGSLSRNMHLSKADFWVREGMRVDKIAFIEKGYLRKFYIKEGKEITDEFYLENSFTADIPSIVSGKNAIANFQAMEETDLLVISFRSLEKLAESNHHIEHFVRVMIQQAFINFYNRSASFILNSPKERYTQLMDRHPEILQRAAQYHIASYLGITPQHLSRLRAG